MPTTHDFIQKVASQIEGLERAHVDQLIAASSERHDKLTGTIAGLRMSVRVLREEAKKWNMGDEE
jgi:hypothetical protein